MEPDRLSNLPKFILHDILSRLSTKYAARTSVLSKTWAETWSTFPILSFSDTEVIGKRMNFIELDDCRKRKKFCDYVERTLLRFHNQGLAVKQFKLTMNNFQDLSNDVDIWLKLVCESGVEVLELHQPCDDYIRKKVRDQGYTLPTSVLEAKLLTKLVLRGGIRVGLTFINHPMKFFSLQVLKLEGVCFGDEQELKHLISLCPLIEDINITTCNEYFGGERHLHPSKNCRVMISLSLHGLQRLKTVDVQGIQELNVDAPCLEGLCYLFFDDLHAPCKIDFDRCRNLRWLILVCSNNTNITEKWFLELFIKLPFLEDLRIQNRTMPKRINISSSRLKKLALSCYSNLEEINIVASNLLSWLYLGFRGDVVKPFISFEGCSSQLVVDIDMITDYHSLCNFREFVENFIPYTVWPSISLFIHWPVADELDPIDLQVSSPPPSIKQLVLQNVPDNEALYLFFVNRLLSSCCPETISICSDFLRCSKAFIKVFYATLTGRNKDNCFCISSHTKCWWHDLKGVTVTSSMNIAENADFKTMLDSFQTSTNNDDTINFKLEF